MQVTLSPIDIPTPFLLNLRDLWIEQRDAALAEDPPRVLDKEEWAMEYLCGSLVPFLAKKIYDQIKAQMP